jgi:hypothetical protein
MLSDPLLVSKWDPILPPRKYLPDGSESMFSRIQRMARAAELERQAEEKDPRLAGLNKATREQVSAEAAKQANEDADTRFWNATPDALRSMGLGEAHVAAIGGLETDWPGMVAVEAWRATQKLFLVLGGPPGTGKTLAASRLLLEGGREWVKCESYAAWQWRPAWAKFVRAADLARKSYFDKFDHSFLQRLENAKWLVLDDLGAELLTDGWKATLLELLDKRMARGRRTAITTNLSGKDFEARYDARVMRRLKEHGTFAAVKALVKAVGT